MPIENSFCSQCGSSLPEGVNFCPKCGAAIPGTDGYKQVEQQNAELQAAMTDGHRTMLLLALAVYIVPAVIGAIVLMADVNSIADALIKDEAFRSWMTSHNWSLDNVKDYIFYVGILEIVSALFACVSFLCVFRQEKRIVASVCCFVAAALCFWSFFGMFLGFMVAFIILTSEPIFKDEVKTIE